MQYTVNIQNPDKVERFFEMLRLLELELVIVEKKKNSRKKVAKKTMPIIRGDKSIDPMALVGIWKDYPITLEEIRAKAWRNHKIDLG